MNLDLLLNQKLDFITKGLSAEIKGAYNTSYGFTKKRKGLSLIHIWYSSPTVHTSKPCLCLIDTEIGEVCLFYFR